MRSNALKCISLYPVWSRATCLNTVSIVYRVDLDNERSSRICRAGGSDWCEFKDHKHTIILTQTEQTLQQKFKLTKVPWISADNINRRHFSKSTDRWKLPTKVKRTAELFPSSSERIKSASCRSAMAIWLANRFDIEGSAETFKGGGGPNSPVFWMLAINSNGVGCANRINLLTRFRTISTERMWIWIWSPEAMHHKKYTAAREYGECLYLYFHIFIEWRRG